MNEREMKYRLSCAQDQDVPMTNYGILIEDTGIGIPENDIDRIFERFYRVDKSHSNQKEGSGLGLSIVKHGAKYHHASIEVESKLNQGTKITIVFQKEAKK